MIEDNRHCHFCECSGCMNVGGGVKLASAGVVRQEATNRVPAPMRVVARPTGAPKAGAVYVTRREPATPRWSGW